MPARRKPAAKPADAADRTSTPLRIIGGKFKGRKLIYSGDERTRPMKDRVREAVFNLVGPDVAGKHALDLFAGTGALGLEAVSRGAARATLIEQHFPTAAIIRRNAEQVGIDTPGQPSVCQVIAANAFIWVRRLALPVNTSERAPVNDTQGRPDLGDLAWVVFCSPPYAFYSERADEMLEMIRTLVEQAPATSVLVVEADARFDFALLPDAERWSVREYWPAVVGVYKKAREGLRLEA